MSRNGTKMKVAALQQIDDLTEIIPVECELLHICCPPRMRSFVRNGGFQGAPFPVLTCCLCGNIRSTPTGGGAVHTIEMDQRSNQLLASLPHEDLQLLIPHLSSVQLSSGAVLAEPGAEVDHAYFPLSGAVSLLVVMRDGKTIETGTVGREGVVGAMSGIGLCKWQVRAVAQLPMFARKIASAEFRKAVSSSKAIADLCLRCNESFLTQARISAACNAVHRFEARFCRWLLQTRDRAESDTIMVTHEFLAQMLGVRRTTVTETSSKIQAAGAITCSRGVIKMVDLEAVKAMACECYETTLREQAS
jgi:CRP-like cAMP-binding protein